MSPPKSLKVIETDDESSLTDEQIKALKELSPEQIRLLRAVAETSKAIQIIIALIVGIVATVTALNAVSIKSFLSKVFQ